MCLLLKLMRISLHDSLFTTFCKNCFIDFRGWIYRFIAIECRNPTNHSTVSVAQVGDETIKTGYPPAKQQRCIVSNVILYFCIFFPVSPPRDEDTRLEHCGKHWFEPFKGVV
jgi:hypothetical protein